MLLFNLLGYGTARSLPRLFSFATSNTICFSLLPPCAGTGGVHKGGPELEQLATPDFRGMEEPVGRSWQSVLNGPGPQRVRPLNFSAKKGLGQSPEETLVWGKKSSETWILDLICSWFALGRVLFLCPQFTLSEIEVSQGQCSANFRWWPVNELWILFTKLWKDFFFLVERTR